MIPDDLSWVDAQVKGDWYEEAGDASQAHYWHLVGIVQEIITTLDTTDKGNTAISGSIQIKMSYSLGWLCFYLYEKYTEGVYIEKASAWTYETNVKALREVSKELVTRWREKNERSSRKSGRGGLKNRIGQTAEGSGI